MRCIRLTTVIPALKLSALLLWEGMEMRLRKLVGIKVKVEHQDLIILLWKVHYLSSDRILCTKQSVSRLVLLMILKLGGSDTWLHLGDKLPP